MRKFEELYSRATDGIYSVSKYLLLAVMAEMVILIATNVFGRYVLRSSISWAEEVVRYSLVWMSFLGAACGYKNRELVAMTTFVKKINPGVRWKIGLLMELTMAFLLVLAIYFGVKITIMVISQTSPATQVSMSLIYISIPLNCIVMVSYSLKNILHYIFHRKPLSLWGENW
jgi:TRAP-type C4-dicarboxylate transport system permease small subunit